VEHPSGDSAVTKKTRARCPVDRTLLVEQVVGHASLATCSECAGIWLTRGARVSPTVDPALLPAASRIAREQSRRLRKILVCPGCGAYLIAERVEGVEIDRCKECQGIWLDAGEYEAVRKRIEILGEKASRSQEKPLGTKENLLVATDAPAEIAFAVIEALLHLIP
jgi:Zn-finger nucleic acid-binding protein